MSLSHLSPQPLWSIFEDLSAIPRPSGHEEAALQYLEKRLDDAGVKHWRDKTGNLMMRKAASAGFEEAPGVVLQSHIDMVPQKADGVDHDFTKDGLTLEIDGDWLTAKGTTLGADNGIGVATIMAAMESTDLSHGPLEGLITIDEERGLQGAQGLEAGLLQGDILLNLDSEDEGELFIGCAGGSDLDVSFAFENARVPQGLKFYDLTASGLTGGHSGVDIHLGRANAIKLLSQFMQKQMKRLKVGLCSFDGGTLRNAIPRDAHMVIGVPHRFSEEFTRAFSKYQTEISKRYSQTDPNLTLTLSPNSEIPNRMMKQEFAERVLAVLTACPSNAARMSTEAIGVTETSNNLAVVTTSKDAVTIRCMSRSLVWSAQEEMVDSLIALFELAGGKIQKGTSFGGWTPNPESPVLKKAMAVYEDLFDVIPSTNVMHAGLECGLLGQAYPEWDMISFGPTIKGAHSPSERVEIATVEKYWVYFSKLLGALKAL